MTIVPRAWPGRDRPAQWWIMRARIHDWVEANRVQITLPHAGEWLFEPNLECLRARLLEYIEAWEDGALPGALIVAQEPIDRRKPAQEKRDAAARARRSAQAQFLEADRERLLAFAARLDKEAEAFEQTETLVAGPQPVQLEQ